MLPARGERFWDGRMTHNPTIHRWGDTYLLYYVGTTYQGDAPAPERPATRALRDEARPAVMRRSWLPAGSVDRLMVTNPAPCVLPDAALLVQVERISGPLRRGWQRPTTMGLRSGWARAIFRFRFWRPRRDAYVWWKGSKEAPRSWKGTGSSTW
jgi:hypothetical protein